MDDLIPSILKPVVDPDFSGNGSSKTFRKNWARLIQKIYEVDPLTCPKCSSEMKVISVLEDKDVIKKILKHLDLWDTKARPPPNSKKSSQVTETIIDYSDSQLLPSDGYLFYDPYYPVEDYVS